MAVTLSPEDRARVESESLKGLQAEDFDFLTQLFGGGLRGAIRLGRLIQTAKQVVLGGSFREAVVAVIDERRPRRTRTATPKPRLIGKVARPAAKKKAARTPRAKSPRPAAEAAEPGEVAARPSGTASRSARTGSGQAKAKGRQARGRSTGGAGGDDLRSHVQRPGG